MTTTITFAPGRASNLAHINDYLDTLDREVHSVSTDAVASGPQEPKKDPLRVWIWKGPRKLQRREQLIVEGKWIQSLALSTLKDPKAVITKLNNGLALLQGEKLALQVERVVQPALQSVMDQAAKSDGAITLQDPRGSCIYTATAGGTIWIHKKELERGTFKVARLVEQFGTGALAAMVGTRPDLKGRLRLLSSKLLLTEQRYFRRLKGETGIAQLHPSKDWPTNEKALSKHGLLMHYYHHELFAWNGHAQHGLPYQLAIGHQLAQGLRTLHRQEIYHRDLKSENILLDKVSSPKEIIAAITDFGTAQEKPTLMDYWKVEGTISCWPPEACWWGHNKTLLRQFHRKYSEAEAAKILSSARDVWAFGLLLYGSTKAYWPPWAPPLTDEQDPNVRLKLLAGAYQNLTRESQAEKGYSEPARDLDSLDRIMWECLDPNPEGRPTAEELAERFDALMSNQPVRSPNSPGMPSLQIATPAGEAHKTTQEKKAE